MNVSNSFGTFVSAPGASQLLGVVPVDDALDGSLVAQVEFSVADRDWLVVCVGTHAAWRAQLYWLRLVACTHG